MGCTNKEVKRTHISLGGMQISSRAPWIFLLLPFIFLLSHYRQAVVNQSQYLSGTVEIFYTLYLYIQYLSVIYLSLLKYSWLKCQILNVKIGPRRKISIAICIQVIHEQSRMLLLLLQLRGWNKLGLSWAKLSTSCHWT